MRSEKGDSSSGSGSSNCSSSRNACVWAVALHP